jgi:hypothetical protein
VVRRRTAKPTYDAVACLPHRGRTQVGPPPVATHSFDPVELADTGDQPPSLSRMDLLSRDVPIAEEVVAQGIVVLGTLPVVDVCLSPVGLVVVRPGSVSCVGASARISRSALPSKAAYERILRDQARSAAIEAKTTSASMPLVSSRQRLTVSRNSCSSTVPTPRGSTAVPRRSRSRRTPTRSRSSSHAGPRRCGGTSPCSPHMSRHLHPPTPPPTAPAPHPSPSTAASSRLQRL